MVLSQLLAQTEFKFLTGTLKIYKKNNFDLTVPLASSDPEANSLGSIVLKSTLQHLFSCSYYT